MYVIKLTNMGKTVKPLKPSDIVDNLETIIPSVVIEAVNNLLKKKFRGTSATIKQQEIIDEIIRLDDSMTSRKIFDEKWMDFEEIFKKNGWAVKYDGPGYSESYDAYFVFTPKKK